MIQEPSLVQVFYCKKISENFIMSSVKSIHSISQSFILTPYLTPMPAISNFALLILRPKKEKIYQTFWLLQLLISRFFKNRECHLHKQCKRKYGWEIVGLQYQHLPYLKKKLLPKLYKEICWNWVSLSNSYF